TAIAAAGTRLASEPEIMRYEQGIAKQFKQGNAELSLLALAHVARFSSRLPAWLSSARQADPKRDWDDLQRIFESLLTGDIASIETAVHAAHRGSLGLVVSIDLEHTDRASPMWLHIALQGVVNALTLLGRGDLLAALHARSLQRLGSGQ